VSKVAVAVARGHIGKTGMGTSYVGSRYQRTGENAAGQGGLVHAIVNCKL
jgi:hypothetical protein